MKFNRREFMLGLHSRARSRRELAKSVGVELSYRDLLKNKSEIDKFVTAYEVSFQHSYINEKSKNALYMQDRVSFTVYAISTPNTQNDIYERLKSAVLDAKGTYTGDSMNLGTQNYFDLNDKFLKLKVMPRGLEEVGTDKKVINENVYSKLASGKYHTEQLDKSFILKNNRGNSSKMKLDIRHF